MKGWRGDHQGVARDEKEKKTMANVHSELLTDNKM